MSEQVQQRVERHLLRYRMDTRPHLTAEDAELYLMAAIDEVSLACLLVDLGTTPYPDPLRDAPHTAADFAKYRRLVTVVSIDYRNPWELVLQILGSAGAVAAAIQAMYLLRSSRRKTEAETEKLRAEAEKLKAETRNLNTGQRLPEDLERRLEAHENALHQLELASALLSRERQDRTTREFLAEVILSGRYSLGPADIDGGLRRMNDLLSDSMLDVTEQVTGPTTEESLRLRQQLLQDVADNSRLLASIRRLDGIDRSVEVLDGGSQN